MRKAVLVVASVIGLIGVILSLILLITAIRFGELGRTLLYFVTLLISAEMFGICLTKLFGRQKDR